MRANELHIYSYQHMQFRKNLSSVNKIQLHEQKTKKQKTCRNSLSAAIHSRNSHQEPPPEFRLLAVLECGIGPPSLL